VGGCLVEESSQVRCVVLGGRGLGEGEGEGECLVEEEEEVSEDHVD
jgi:hypothetical protein